MDPLNPLLLQFIETLHATVDRHLSEIGDQAALGRLTMHQMQYIEAIGGLGEPTITEIAETLNITKASVTVAVNKLISQGYAQKTRSTLDQRVWHVQLSPEARRLSDAKLHALNGYVHFLRATLNDEEVAQLEHLLIKLVGGFQTQQANSKNG